MILFVDNVSVAFATTHAQTQVESTPDLGNAVKGNIKKAQGKIQETYGNATGDRNAQIEGKVNQAEGEIRLTQGGSEWDIEGKTRQAENNIHRYQSRQD
ncbi:MAG: CsbD family protein [Scytonematopsis contorta HA4267-MV1]|nr:CsbD family protein [Scytonematopsis contorta HA4267-MV1]